MFTRSAAAETWLPFVGHRRYACLVLETIGVHMKHNSIIFIALLATGCATPTWRHANKGTQEFYRDNSQCMAMGGSGQAPQVADNKDPVMQGYNQGLAMGAQANQRMIYQQCMYGNGWSLSR